MCKEASRGDAVHLIRSRLYYVFNTDRQQRYQILMHFPGSRIWAHGPYPLSSLMTGARCSAACLVARAPFLCTKIGLSDLEISGTTCNYSDVWEAPSGYGYWLLTRKFTVAQAAFSKM